MRFRENECRLCKQVFCCKNCRLKHEKAKHQIEVDCGICNSGYLFQKSLNGPLLEHIKGAHWPVHCVFCKYIFSTVAELKQHTRCSIVKEDSPNTPFRNLGVLVNSEDSPILTTQQQTNPALKLITSTPMLRNENVKDFNKNSEMITPVEHNNAKPSDNATQLLKRRVTFCEVSAVDSSKTDTPAREPDNKLFPAGVTELCTPQQDVIPNIDEEEHQIQFSTPERFVQSFIVDDEGEKLEFSIPARLTDGSVGDQSNSSTKEINAIIMSSETAIDENEVYDEKEAIKDGSTIWMSALNLSISSSSSDEEETKNETNENNSVQQNDTSISSVNISQSSPPVIKNLPPVVCPTPAVKEAVIADNEECSNEDKENITMSSPVRRKILKIHPTPHPILKKRDVNITVLDSSEIHTPDIALKNSPEKRIVKVQPTPIIKQTKLHMKFRIPAHLSSTPILNMHPQPKMMKKVLTQQIIMHQGENYCETSTTATLQQINQSESLSGIHKDPMNESEDTNSNLWTSMTRIMKRVIQRSFNSMSQENQRAIGGTSFKRHFSDSDSSEMSLTPQVKRFKFTDIKCRRPIRDLSPPRSNRMLALPGTSGGDTTFEIVKSVTTSQGVSVRKTYVDKATQTDDDYFVQ